MSNLDKNSPIPLYYQIYSTLLRQIEAGELKPGDMLPTETSLIVEYNVSRATVRQAILDLARNGYVVREKSKGTFVRDYTHTVGYADRLKGFSARSSQGGTIALSSKVLEKSVLIPPKNVREALRLEPEEKVFYLRRIRYIRGEASTYAEDWLPYKLCPGIEKEHFTDASLYEILDVKYHVIPHHAVRTFECSMASTEEQIRVLELDRNNAAILRCESWVYDQKDEPVEYYTALIKGKFTVQER